MNSEIEQRYIELLYKLSNSLDALSSALDKYNAARVVGSGACSAPHIWVGDMPVVGDSMVPEGTYLFYPRGRIEMIDPKEYLDE